MRAFTLAAAETSGQSDRLGTITPGRLADLTILSQHIFELPAEALLETTVDATLVGGVFRPRTF